jgi:hypothetical protein
MHQFQIPEPEENFTISLSLYSGKARIGSRNQALVVIRENDHRLYFRGRVRRAAVLSGTRFLFGTIISIVSLKRTYTPG